MCKLHTNNRFFAYLILFWFSITLTVTLYIYIFRLLFLVVNQFYDAEIIKEYVIRGNTAVLKCSIPSFVADFVYVDSWIDEEGTVYKTSDNYGLWLHSAIPNV